ncbi:MAG: hypothetical protein ACO1SV_26485 [Fimbriimonas sp.]
MTDRPIPAAPPPNPDRDADATPEPPVEDGTTGWPGLQEGEEAEDRP